MESKIIIADTDFLSAFLKVDRLELVFKALETKEIVIAGTVLHEIEQASVYSQLLDFLQSKDKKVIVKKVTIPVSDDFGRGELESISLAEESDGLLLMNDRKAAKFAESRGITVMDIPIFLFHCKTSNHLSSKELTQIIKDLKEKDYYEFSMEVKEKLLK